MRSLRKILVLIVMAVLVLPSAVNAQNRRPAPKNEEEKDSLVRLIKADSLMLFEQNGQSFRKTVGKPVRFFHNNTYLLCDTAIWNVDQQIINAYGKVQIIQDGTTLSSDRLTYYVDRDLAEFRGSIVKLEDKDKNTLKTMYLDYNTKDSVAVFRNGASMRDKDGQIIESLSGTYDSKAKTFIFSDNVNMYTDSVFVKTTHLKYESEYSLATFGYNTNAWKDDSMLSANAGTYDRSRELFFFNRDVHVMNETQEAWSDSLYFNRATMDVTMLGRAQITDTTRNVYGVAGRLEYIDSLSRLTMTRLPAVVAEVDDEENGRDSVWFGADTIVYWSVKRCEVDSMDVVDAQTRLKSIETDPVSSLRKSAAEAAAKAAEEAAANDPNNPENAAKRKAEYEKQHQKPAAEEGKKKEAPKKPDRISFKKDAPPAAADTTALATPADTVALAPPADTTTLAPPADTTTLAAPLVPADSTVAAPAVTAPEAAPSADVPSEDESDGEVTAPGAEPAGDMLPPLDSLSNKADSLKTPLDTTKIGFISAVGRVKIFRRTMQVLCDSLRYCDLDSLARLYIEPKIWNEVTHQYIADSVYIVVRNDRMEKANLMSDAFIHIQEDSTHFDQIRSAEMVAYFDENNQLARFDALGGALALFYVEENDALATVNKKDAKMLSANFKDGSIQRIHYFQDAKSDAYPVVQMSRDDQTLKGFAWTPEERPKDRYAVSDLVLRQSQRSRYARMPQASFPQTEIYFPGYMDDVHRQIAFRDSMKVVRAREREEAKRRAEELARLDSLNRADSLASGLDSLAAGLDSLAAGLDSLTAGLDSLAEKLDTLGSGLDSLGVAGDSLAVGDTTVHDLPALTPEEIKQQEKEAAAAAKAAAKEAKKKVREEKKAARLAALEAKWAEQDRRDSLKQAARDAKKLEKERRKKEKALNAQLRQEAKDKAALEKYIYRLERKKAKEEAKRAKAEARRAKRSRE